MKKNISGELIFEDIAVNIPEILLPCERDPAFWHTWACVACDQYTSEPEYWKRVESLTEGKKSAYRLILPELCLEQPDVDERIRRINRTMEEYVAEGVLRPSAPSLILVERDTGISPTRRGVLLALDLEAYDYRQGSGSLIRATEGTVTERIPPRMKIRKEAVLEMPHVMILIDDPERTVVEPLFALPAETLYDFTLMEGGGHIRGRRVTDPRAAESMAAALAALADPRRFAEKYGVSEGTPVLLYAVGDGNHSLAAAKCHWEALKAQGAGPEHPARYALTEVVNIHDPGIVFEPIHRVLFGVNPAQFFDELEGYFADQASYMENITECEAREYPGCHTVRYRCPGHSGQIFIDRAAHPLATGAMQEFLDRWLQGHPACRIDYIHGEDVAERLAEQPGNMGFFLPAMDKADFFPTVIGSGSLPRKTFSMGEAFEKRYYIECRKIVP